MFKKILGVIGALILIPSMVLAAPVVSINKGGTGTSTTPTYGQVFVGNGSGGWDYFATSSLGLSTASSTLLADDNSWTGLNTFGETTTFNDSISLPSGSVSNPSLSFLNNPTVGFFGSTPNFLSLSVNGATGNFYNLGGKVVAYNIDLQNSGGAVTVVSSSLYTNGDGQYDIGRAVARWKKMFSIGLETTDATTSNAWITGLADPAGSFLAVSPTGAIIATTSPTGGAQTPWTSNIDGGTYNLTNVGIASSTSLITGAISVPDYIKFNNTDENTLLGYEAGKNIAPGSANNTFIGYRSGNYGTFTDAADGNTAVGAYSLQDLTSGVSNVAIGTNGLKDVTTGYHNIGIGQDVLSKLTTGQQNVSIGSLSLFSLISGSFNTSIGKAALYNTLGSSNVAFGYYAGFYETGSNAFYVNNQDRTNTAGDKTGSLLYGTFNATPSLQTLTVNGSLTVNGNAITTGTQYVEKMGIGTTSPIATLSIVGDGGESTGIVLNAGSNGDDVYLYNEGGSKLIIGDSNVLGGNFPWIELDSSSLSIGTDSGFTGTIDIANDGTEMTIGAANSRINNITETGTVFATSSVNASEQMLPADIEHGLIEVTPNTESFSLLLPAVTDLPATFIPIGGDRRLIQLFNATTTTGITVTLDANGDTDWVGSDNVSARGAEIMQTFSVTRLSDGRIYIEGLTL